MSHRSQTSGDRRVHLPCMSQALSNQKLPEHPPLSISSDLENLYSFQNKHLHLFVVFVAGGLAEVDAAIEAQLEREPDGRWRCLSCLDYSSVSRQTAKAHVESKHISSAGFMCHACAKTCPTRHALKMHKIRNKH